MKVIKTTAFKDDEGALWETEKEAIESNVESCLNKINITGGDSYSNIIDKIKVWFLNEKASVKYVQVNLKKIDS